MTTTFNITFDVRRGLALVADETVITDLVGLHIERNPDGTYACAVTREGSSEPVQLVPTDSRAGRQAMARATGQLSSPVPGFVEVPAEQTEPTNTRTEDIAEFLGWKRPDKEDEQGRPSC